MNYSNKATQKAVNEGKYHFENGERYVMIFKLPDDPETHETGFEVIDFTIDWACHKDRMYLLIAIE